MSRQLILGSLETFRILRGATVFGDGSPADSLKTERTEAGAGVSCFPTFAAIAFYGENTEMDLKERIPST